MLHSTNFTGTLPIPSPSSYPFSLCFDRSSFLTFYYLPLTFYPSRPKATQTSGTLMKRPDTRSTQATKDLLSKRIEA
ncbi:hypothetical protein H6F86_06570 [Phormidium sp. FACHB-592]|uniref:Uncharacterized protein n=1 Tax=Stenomitos frigidus AS-A4 TaxID=2933935 RepID=A0ABV0KHD0_9CYAN|nr:hypothetical protein [Phormidium sp. FACHB-592]